MAPLTIYGNTLDPDSEHGPRFPSDASGTNFILIQTDHNLTLEEILELRARGVDIGRLFSSAENILTYLCRYEPSDLRVIESLPFIQRAFVYHEDFVVHSDLKSADLDASPYVLTKKSALPDGKLGPDVVVA